MSNLLLSGVNPPRTLVFHPPLTEAQFFALCIDNDAIQFERTRQGEILMQAPAGGFTSGANLLICGELYTWWTTHRRGRVFDSSGGFLVGDGSMLNPDASYVLPQKFAGLTKDDLTGFPHLCPDFIIELLSVTDSVPKSQEKLQLWMDNGAALGWLIDPYNKQVYVYQPGHEVVVESGQLLHGSGPVEGFALDLLEVWQCYEI